MYLLLLVLALPAMALSMARNSTFTNPMLPGFHPDPTCIYVADKYDSFFCTTSSFITFPGMPIYASKDLINWKQTSYVFSRPSQVPHIQNTTIQNAGLWAPTIRYRNGTFYVIVPYTPMVPWGVTGFLFTTTDPYDSSAWSDPLVFPLIDIDPNLFWDDDGTVYLQCSGIHQQTIDLKTGALGPATKIWDGFTKFVPEAPRMYKRDGYYYLLIAEGGTELGHHAAIARSKNIWGPYESDPWNPILTNTGTNEYFQTVGHPEFFQDKTGNWWGVGLATRSGPQWQNYPMGRETVLFPVTWNKGEWPVLSQVRGKMSGWALPQQTRNLPGSGPFLQDPDVIDFPCGSSIPPHFVHWRFPPKDAFTVCPPGHDNTLRLRPSKSNLTSSDPTTTTPELSLVMRVQTDTLFTFSVDVSFNPKAQEEEAGVTAFLTQTQHIDLGLVNLPTSGAQGSGSELKPHLRFRVTYVPTRAGNFNGTIPTVVKALPATWKRAGGIRLWIDAINATHYAFSAAPAKEPWKRETLGQAPATILSGGDGRFTGALVGVYSTSNGGNGTSEAYISRWRYRGLGQEIGNGTYVPYSPFVYTH